MSWPLDCDCGRRIWVNPPKEDRVVKCVCGRKYLYKMRSDKYVRANYLKD